MKSIVLATGNQGKLKEIQEVLSPFGFSVQKQSDFNVPEAEENGLSFVENAIIKARNAAAVTGQPALADDSGLEVDFLNGEPGIYSARFAGPQAKDSDNVTKLLSLMTNAPGDQRKARFQCVMVYLQHAKDPTPIICQGTWEGLIANEPCGNNGFGYDPVFWVPTHECCAAELTSEIKNSLSHRGQALKKFIEAVKQGL